MDRLKFRVWDKTNKFYDDGFIIHADKGIIEYPEGGWDIRGYDDNENGNYIIEQCTGIKDINGKLVYEGDIISYELDNDGLFIFVVKYSEVFNGYGTITYTRYAGLFSTELNKLGYGIRVIGNIHENRDLLGG